ncbi:MAG: TraR/DksA family transcriptional regulator [Desulfovibrionaceae bacterium]|jgi:DnaK suppressor protein|nr:TraR/DksA family transcriptional regulator [Desulfovibrionaceae bacterium]
MSDSERYAIRRCLLEALETLNLRSHREKADFSLCADLNEYASRVFDHEMDSTLRERDLARMDEIKDALARLDDPDFGYCEECGGEIGRARLTARPTATLCVECQALLENSVAA